MPHRNFKTQSWLATESSGWGEGRNGSVCLSVCLFFLLQKILDSPGFTISAPERKHLDVLHASLGAKKRERESKTLLSDRLVCEIRFPKREAESSGLVVVSAK